MTDDQAPWHHLAAELRGQIQRGELAVGNRLPSEESLTQRTGLSRTTVRRAVHQLHAEGLIELRPPAGSFVVDTASPVALGPGESVTLRAASTLVRPDGSTRTLPAGTPLVPQLQTSPATPRAA